MMPEAASVEHRQHVLRALGVTPYRLRREMAARSTTETAATAAGDGPAACVWILPSGCDARQSALLEHIKHALGPVFAQAAQIEVVGDELATQPPAARAYLALGEAQARALGRVLSVDVMARAEVVLLDRPDALLRAEGKRRLWQAVAGLRRRWLDSDERAG
ncbi:MAG TPA: hypothetical protein VF271_00285 [Rhodanobacteraceae bacterium]